MALLAATFPAALAGSVAIDGTPHLRYSDALYGPPPGPAGRWTDASAELAHQPWDALIVTLGKGGELPLWQPYGGLGSPLLGNGQSAPFSPYKWLVLPWTDGRWTGVFLLGRLAMAGLGMLALAAVLGLSPAAGFLAGAGFMLSGFLCVHLVLTDTHVNAFLPWLLLAAEALRRRPDRRHTGLMGLAIGVTGLLGHPEPALMACLAAVAAYLGSCLWAREPLGRRAGAMAVAIALGAGIAAVVVLPFLEFVGLSESYLFDRRTLYPWMGLGHIAAYTGIHLVAPLGTNASYNVFVGVALAVLAPLGLRAPQVRAHALPPVGVALLIYLLCPPVGLLASWPHLPNSFYASPLLGIGLALLGAAGVDQLRAAPRSRAAGALGGLAALGALALLAYALAPVPWRLGDMGIAGGMLLAVACVVLAARGRGVPRAAVTSALVLLATFDLWVAARAVVPTFAPLGYPETPIVQRIKAAGGLDRAAGHGEALLPNTTLVHGIHSLEMIEAFHLKRYSTFMAALNGSPRTGLFNFRVVGPGFDAALADLAGLRWLVVGDGPRGAAVRARLEADPARYALAVSQPAAALFESRTPLARARVLHAADFIAPGDPASANRLRANARAWRTRALIETPDGRPPAGWRDAAVPATPVEVVGYGAHRVELATRLTRPGWLVLADAYYPGWEAEVDGRPAPVLPAYVAFRGVWLAAGDHRVVFRYAPRSVRVGLAISLFSLTLGVLAWAWPRRRRRLRVAPPQPGES